MKDKEEEKQKEEEEEMRSVTSKDFNIDDFVPKEPAPTAVSLIFQDLVLLAAYLRSESRDVMRLLLYCFC